MPNVFSPCPPCKIILDGGIIELATDLYAGTTRAIGKAFDHAITTGVFGPEQIDEAHALSELWCHRAVLLRKWAEDDRLHATGMLGGEYSGAFAIDGVDGIHIKGD